MADADVQVTFGAKIDGLISGIDAIKASLDGLNTKFEEVHKHADAMSTHIGSIGTTLKSFAAAFAAAFSIEGLESFVHRMAELGSRLETISLTMGMPVEKVVELAGVAKITGTSIDSLTASIERMSLNIQRSARDGTNAFSSALKNLGLSTKDFIGLRGDEYFAKIAEAVSKFNPSMALTNNLTLIGGRNMASMVGVLLQGKEAFQKYGAQINQASEGLAAAQPGMADTHTKLALLSISVDSLGARLFTVLKPAIDMIIGKMTEWVQSLDSATLISGAKAVANALVGILESVGEFVIQILELIDQVKAALKSLEGSARYMKDPIGALATDAREGIKTWVYETEKELERFLGMAEHLVSGMDQEFNVFTETVGQFNRRMEQRREDFAKTVAGYKAAVAELGSVLTAASAGAGTAHGPTSKLDAKQPVFPSRGGDDAIAVAMRQVAEVDRIYQMSAEKAEHTFKMSVDFFGQAESQKTQALLSALATRENAELAIMLNLQHKYAEGTNERRRVEDEITKIVQKATNDRQKINDHAAEATWQKWKSASDQLAGTFSTAFQGLITGGQTVSQVMQGLVRSLINTMISEVTKMVFQVIAQKTMLLVTGQGFAAADVATTVAAEGAKTGAVTAGVAARTSAEAAGSGAGILTTIFDAIGFIFAQAGKAFAAVFALFAGVMGPAAAGPASAAAGEVIAGGTALAVGGAAVGTDYVMKSGLAVIHQGEQVVPADIGGAYTGARSGGSGAGGGGGSVSVNISAWDGGSIHRWLSTGGAAQLAKAIGPVLNRNPSLRPSY